MWSGQYTEEMSHSLTVLMDSIGFTEDARKLISEGCKTTDLIDNISSNITGNSICFKQMGSTIEATNLMTQDSDIDCIHYNPKIEVRDKSYVPPSDFPYLLMVKDRMTKPGYTKLQLYKEGQCIKHDKIMQDEFYIKFLPDSMGRVVLSNEFTEAYANCSIKLKQKRHGPANTSYHNHANLGVSYDYVLAYICQFIPEVSEPWFQRQRTNGWPSSETCELFKKMGCFVVPVGHPGSPEENLEWRISLSNQEFFLMHNLTMVQYRCYMLLKMVKTQFIKPACGDIITSYHCKTALLYTIENTYPDIWRSENLSFCLLKCLEQLSEWVDRKNCPNYFIPEENMFEAKLSDNDQKKLKKYFSEYVLNEKCILQLAFPTKELKNTTFTYELAHSIRIAFKNAMIALLKDLYIHSIHNTTEWFIEYLKAVLECICYSAEVYVIRAFQAFPEKIVYSWFVQKMFPQSVEISCRLILPKLQDIAPYMYSNTDIRKTFSLIEKHILRKLESLHLVKALRGTDMKAFECFFKALSYGKQAGSVNDLQNEIKLASYLFVIGDYHLCLKNLKKARLTFSGTPVTCFCQFSHLLHRKLHERDIFGIHPADRFINSKTVLPMEKQIDEISRCLNFDTYELDLVPCALIYESFRSFGTPVYSSWKDDLSDIYKQANKDEYRDTCWVRVDPFVYLYFLQYNSYEALCDGGNKSAALNKLETHILNDLKSTRIPHFDTALNVLGHLYASKGWYVLALECFRKSWKIMLLHNAAKWHVMFLLLG